MRTSIGYCSLGYQHNVRFYPNTSDIATRLSAKGVVIHQTTSHSPLKLTHSEKTYAPWRIITVCSIGITIIQNCMSICNSILQNCLTLYICTWHICNIS